MRINRLYVNDPLETGIHINLDKQQSHYLLNVLRLKTQDNIIVFDGSGDQAQAQINITERQRVALEIINKEASANENRLTIHLVQGLSRGDRMDFTVQKAVELGVTEITPLYTEYSNIKLDAKRSQRKLEHWRKIAISACEQCGQNYLPTINEPIRLGDLLTMENPPLTRIVMDPYATQSVKSLTLHDQTVMIVAGPEGGFSDSELQLFESRAYSAIRLGPRILRTETAAIALITACQTLWGDFA